MKIKVILSNIIYKILEWLGGEAFANRHFSPRLLLKHWFSQKILRRNSHVPWPVHRSSFVKSPENIERGDRCPGLSPWVYLDGRNGIRFGNNVWVGPGVRVISMNHDPGDYNRYVESDPIVIGDHCWLGANAVVLPGVTLGEHVVVGAGSIVTKSFGDNVMIAGNPARVIRQLEAYREEGDRSFVDRL